MFSIPRLPKIGSSVNIQIRRVNLNPQTAFVEIGGILNDGQENRDIKEQLEKIEFPAKKEHSFEGKPGEVCLVYEDTTVHRARILSKIEHEYRVFLIDDGKILWASSKSLAQCPDNLCSLSPKVELCMLSGVSPLCLEGGCSLASSAFITSLFGKTFSGCVQDVIMPSRIILLDIPSLAKQMFEFGLATKISIDNFINLVMDSLSLRGPSVQTDPVSTNEQQEHASDPDKWHRYLYPQLSPGTIEIVTVTQIVHPLKIYCRLSVFSQELMKLSHHLHEYYEDEPYPQLPMLLCNGSPCATKGSDGKWYRSVLQQNDITDVVKVFHVDYGIGDFVKLCNIRPLASRFLHLPVVTYACSLHGVSDKGVGWRTDQIDYLKSIILDQTLVGKFENYSTNQGVYHVTLYGNDNVNVNNTFGQREQCCIMTENSFSNQTLQTLNKVMCKKLQNTSVLEPFQILAPSKEISSTIEDGIKVQYTRTDQQTNGAYTPNPVVTPSPHQQAWGDSVSSIEMGEMSKVRITCVQSINHFYGHFAENADTVRKIAKDIQHLCRKHQQAKYSVVPEMLCLAKYSDGQWHRGQIKSTHPNIVAKFVDFGDLMVLDKSDIMQLPLEASSIARVPIQAVQFELFNLKVPDSSEVNEWFKNYATDRMFTVTVKQYSFGKQSVEIWDDKMNINLKIQDMLSKTKQKEPSLNKSASLKASGWLSSTVSEEPFEISGQFSKTVAHGNKVPSFKQAGVNRAQPSIHENLPRYPKLTDLPPRVLNSGYVSEIYVSHYNNPSSFFVQLASDEEEIFSINDRLNSSQNSHAEVDLNLLHSGDLVSAEFPADGAWYRAVVQNKRDGLVEVEFVDFGNEVTLLPCKIKQLDKKFLCTPRLSVHCTLEDGQRGKKDWTKEDVVAFKKAIGEKRIQCHFIREVRSSWFVGLDHEEGHLVSGLQGVEIESKICHNESTPSLDFKKPAITNQQIIEAFASSIVGPQYFWCQFKNTKELDKICRIAQEFGNSNHTRPIQPDQLNAGRPCIARFSDHLWYRAKVISKLVGKVSVLFIDYGNESEVDLDSIKSLPSELLESAPQAFLCQLEVFKSLNCAWSNTAADEFFELLLDKPLKVTIQSMQMSPDVPMCPQYSVQVESKGLNVNDLMKEYLTDHKPQVRRPTAQCSERFNMEKNTNGNAIDYGPTFQSLPQLLDLPPHAMEPGTVSEVYISHINTVSSFFVQLRKEEGRNFSLTELLNSTNPSKKDEIPMVSLQLGSLVKAMFPEDNSWYRAVVKDITKDGMINVEFVDFGNEATVPIHKICRLDKQLLSYPRFSIHCSCGQDDRFKILTEAKESIILFKELFGEAGEKKLSCRFLRKDDTFWEVKISPSCGTDYLSVNLDLHFKKPDVSVGQTVNTFASCIVGPDYFWCQFSDSRTLDHITIVSQECGNSSETQPILLGNLNCGSSCLARFLDDQLWYRAEVIKKSKDAVSVIFVDFGNESEVTESSVKPLSSDLLEIPPQAFLCQLEGFDHLLGSWESEATDYFYELLLDKPLKVTIVSTQSSDNPSSPSFYVKVEAQQCVVNELMKKFWSASVAPNQDNTQGMESSGKAIEFASVDQPSSGCKMIEKNAVFPIASDSSLKLDHTHPNPLMIGSKDMEKTSQQLFKKTDVSIGQRIEAFASCIVGPDYFWCQFSNSEVLDHITVAAQECGNTIKTQPILLGNLDCGSPCLARFVDDQLWYRAEVSKKSTDTVSVIFVDFGNESEVTESSVKLLSSDLLESPPQAFLCQLEGFAHSSGSWENEAADYFYEIVMDKPLKITVEHTQNVVDHNRAPFYVKVESQQFDVNEQMKKFWRAVVPPDQNSNNVIDICENAIELVSIPLGTIGTSESSLKLDPLDPNPFKVVSEIVQEIPLQLFKKPDVSLGQTVEAFASCIVGPDFFWCQHSNPEVLDHITLAAQETGDSIAIEPILLGNLNCGSPCLARFVDDQMWYRAEVIKTSEDTVSVIFVDFGNESEVTEGSVKALPCDMLASPPQAFLCCLEGFNQSLGSWNSEATDYFYELLVDQPLKVTLECTDSVDSSSPPFYVKVEVQECLVNDLMKKFWISPTLPPQDSTDVIESCENSIKPLGQLVPVEEPSVNPVGSFGDNQSEPCCPEDCQIDHLVENGLPENNNQLREDVIVAVPNAEITAKEATETNSDLEIKKECHEPELVLTVEKMLLDTEISTEETLDERSQKGDIPQTPNRRKEWVAHLEKQMLPMVVSEDSCDSVKGVFK